jgi:hypothetical protein
VEQPTVGVADVDHGARLQDRDAAAIDGHDSA